jgi:VanZ family protein
MIAIFWFSHQNAEQSGDMSGAVTRGMFEEILSSFGFSTTGLAIEILEVIIRKLAHLFVYFILGFCTANAVRQITENKRYIFGVSLGWCSFYAATDEWHQYFIPGRAAMWQDWLIDTAGVLLGIGASFLLYNLLRKIIKGRL